MAGTACKIIIDNMRTAVAESMRQALMLPTVRAILGDEKTAELINRLAQNDIDSYMGGTNVDPSGGLANIALELCAFGVYSDDVWQILRHPGNPAVPGGA